MDKKQTSLLLSLAKKLEQSQNSKESALKSLKLAGIIAKNGKFARSYPNLNRVVTVNK